MRRPFVSAPPSSILLGADAGTGIVTDYSTARVLPELPPITFSMAFPLKPFKRVYIEITNACNASCPFCPGASRPVAFMTVASFRRIVENLDGYATHLYFHVLGEPLLHPALSEFFDVAQEHGLRVNLTTNGTRIATAGPLILGKPALRQVTFSLHGFSAGHAELPLDEYMKRIIDFVRAAHNRHLVSLRLWSAGPDASDSPAARILEIIEREFLANLSFSPTERRPDAVRLEENIFLNLISRFSWPDPFGPDCGETGYCLGLREQIAVLVDGTVVPCCLDRNGLTALGNVQVRPIREILGENRARRMYEGFSQRRIVEPLCRHCSYRLRFSTKSPDPSPGR